MSVNIKFVIQPSPGASNKSKQLLDAELRSHAAKVTHQKAGRGFQRPPRYRPTFREVFQLEGSVVTRLLTQGVLPASAAHDGDDAISREAKKNLPTTLMISNDEVADSEKDHIQIVNSEPSSGYILNTTTLRTEIDGVSNIFYRICAEASSSFCNLWKVRSIFTQDWLELFKDEAFAHVGIAFVKYEYSQLVSPHSEVPSDVISHKVEALRVIRRRIVETGGVLDNITLLAIMFLPFVEDLASSFETSKLHWNAVSRMFAGRVGKRFTMQEHNSNHLQEALTQISTYCQFHTGTSLLALESQRTKIPQRPPKAYPFTRMSLVLPKGIEILEQLDLIGPATIGCVQRVMEFTVRNIDGTFAFREPERLSAETLKTSSFVDAWDLLAIKPSTVADEPALEEVLPVSMLVYSGRVSGPLGFANSVSRAARAHLSAKLPCYRTIRGEAEEHALFWVFVMGIEAWRLIDRSLHPEGKKLRDMMFERFPWSTDLEAATSILKKFFYDHELIFSYRSMGELLPFNKLQSIHTFRYAETLAQHGI